jgi:hypothetical protein
MLYLIRRKNETSGSFRTPAILCENGGREVWTCIIRLSNTKPVVFTDEAKAETRKRELELKYGSTYSFSLKYETREWWK